MILSIIIPSYNEGPTLLELLQRVEKVSLPKNINKEIIIINDGSKDNTSELLKNLGSNYKVLNHEINQGKGASVIDGLKVAVGDFAIIQDADLEYDPNDYIFLLEPLLKGECEVVYGSRFINVKRPEKMMYKNWLANKFLTLWSNFFTGLKLSDMETCYKMFSREVVETLKIKLRSKDFSIEPEITSIVKNFKVKEIGINYLGRSHEDGKKIGWIDGFKSFYDVIRFNLPLTRVLKFFIAGTLGALVNLSTLYLLTETLGWWYLASATGSFILASTLSFLLHKFWAFNNMHKGYIHHQYALYFTTAFGNLIINNFILYVLVEYLNVWYIFSQALASLVVATWSFLLYHQIFTREVNESGINYILKKFLPQRDLSIQAVGFRSSESVDHNLIS